jgi:hypothetical protein
MLRGVIVNKFNVLGVVCALLVSASVQADDQDITIQGKPIQVITVDGQKHSLTVCGDYLALRQQNQQLTIGDLSSRDYVEAKDSLIQCNIHNYAKQHQYVLDTQAEVPSIETVVAHFPASAALVVSNDEVNELKKNGGGETLHEWTPSLVLKDERMVSEKEQVAYVVSQYQSFKNSQGQSIAFITLGSGVIDGTFGKRSTYRIDAANGKIWSVTPVTENTSL